MIDPAPAIARQVGRLLETEMIRYTEPRSGTVRFFTSGDALNFKLLLPGLLGEIGEVEQVKWRNKELEIK